MELLREHLLVMTGLGLVEPDVVYSLDSVECVASHFIYSWLNWRLSLALTICESLAYFSFIILR